MLGVTTNLNSLNAQNSLAKTNVDLSKALQQLSTGLKINSGADGPAALVISQEQQAQIDGLNAAIQNTNKATTLVQTAEGALSEINNLLDQIRSLAVDSANTGYNDANALAANQAQVTNALSTIDRIASTTQFGSKNILNGSAGVTGSSDTPASLTFLKGTASAASGTYAVNVTTAAARADIVAGTAQSSNLATAETLTINGVQVSLTAGLSQTQVIAAINQFTGQTGVTAVNNGGSTELYSTQYGSNATISVVSDQTAAATSTGFGTAPVTATGTDVAGTIGGNAATGNGNVLTGDSSAGAAGISVSIKLAAGSNTLSATGAVGNTTVSDNSLVFQIGANSNQTIKVNIASAATSTLGLNVAGDQFANLSQINVQSQSGAQDAIKVIDQAIADITNLRGALGATQQQTLAAGANNLQNVLQNTTAAQSAIRDTDFAASTAQYSKDNILLQVGTAVLQNSNATSQLVLKLFQ